MALPGWLKRVGALGWAEKLLAILCALVLAGGLMGFPAGLQLLLQAGAGGLGLVVLWRFGIRLIRGAIWRLRNRLIVAYLFVAVVPVLLLALLALGSVWVISGQIAAYLLSFEMDRRVSNLKQVSASLVRAQPQNRVEAVRRAGFIFRERFPGLEMLVHDQNGKEVRYPEDSALQMPPAGHRDSAGIVIRDKTYHLWVHTGGPQSEVVVMVPVTRTFLQSLVPQLGEIQLTPISLDPRETRNLDVRLHAPVAGEAQNGAPPGASTIPQAVSALDLRLRWGVFLPVPEWAEPGTLRRIFLGVSTRISGPLKIVFSVETNTDIPVLITVFTGLAIIFLLVELVSAYIGISLSRTITEAVGDLYEATVRIREGDLGHRIQVKGNDQLAELGTSFNIMAGNLERLLESEKVRQRLEAELEIAREVQAQLHPREMSGLGSLEVRSICNAARTVSGDYFDYQAMGETRLALCIGDVAGKGISAALLMATLQSAMRSQLRHCMEMSQAASVGMGEGYAPPRLSTAQLVSNLNQQLYDSTAPEKYATFFFSVYDEQTGTLSYTNAGHLSPVLIHQGKAIPLDSNGMVVGAFPFARYGESQVRLESGDLLVCYTDGITEPENAYGEMFGEERLMELLLANAGRSAGEVAALLVEEATKWTASVELQDDMTVIVAKKV